MHTKQTLDERLTALGGYLDSERAARANGSSPELARRPVTRSRPSVLVAAALVAVMGMSGTLYALTLRSDRPSASPTTETTPSEDIVDTSATTVDAAYTPLMGQLAPLVVTTTIDGEPFELQSRRGSWVVLNFSHPNCVPCIREHDAVAAFVSGGAGGAEFYTVIPTTEHPELAREAFNTADTDWPILIDRDATVSAAFGVIKVPETWIIDPAGIVAYRTVGEVSAGSLGSILASLMAAPESTTPPTPTTGSTIPGSPTTTAVPGTAPVYLVSPPVAVIGDSMLQSPFRAPSLAGYMWTDLTQPSSGLALPDFFDWPGNLDAWLAPLPAGTPVVVAVGGNDGQGLANVDGSFIQTGDSLWLVEYERRAGALMDQIIGGGHPLVWVGVPDAASPDLSSRLADVRTATMAAAAQRPQVRYVDSWTIFAPDGAYTATLVVDGIATEVRWPGDGYHLTASGLDVLGRAITEQLTATGTPPVDTATSAPPPPVPEGPFELGDETPFDSVWTASAAPRDPSLLVISLVGGAPYDPMNFCSIRYRAEVTESEAEVSVQVFAAQAEIPDEWGCPMLGHPRLIGVRLQAPLGERSIVNESFGPDVTIGPAPLPDARVTVIEPGDDLRSVIERTGTSLEQLIASNHWTDGTEHALPEGDVVILPAD